MPQVLMTKIVDVIFLDEIRIDEIQNGGRWPEQNLLIDCAQFKGSGCKYVGWQIKKYGHYRCDTATQRMPGELNVLASVCRNRIGDDVNRTIHLVRAVATPHVEILLPVV
ncbi:MAG TPA: hypothetical protein VGO61_01410 [Steroidobacteraceae bacterium]|nr:hypothetical protein [Steroidobacteraceae bacterium]